MKKLIYYLIANRVLLFLLVFISSGIRPFSEFFLNFARRWDGNSYTFIADHGYVTFGPEKNFLVFPPFYPTFIKIVSLTGINSVVAGAIISNVFFVLGMLVLYKLVKSGWNEKIATLTVILVSIFPTTYFLSVDYPESLFICLFALSFYLANKKSFFLSSLIAGFAASTRPFGLIIFPCLVLFMIIRRGLTAKNLIISGISFAAPLLPYLSINYAITGNPLGFAEILKQNWQKSFDFPWNGILQSWRRGIFTTDSFVYKYFVGYSEAVASTLAWLATLFSFKKWGIKSPYFLYLFFGALFFTSTGFILSAPRYLLSIPPFFILLAEILLRNKFAKFAWFLLSLGLLVWFSWEFALGRWAF